MVKLGFDLRGYEFDVGLKAIDRGFEASVTALRLEVDRIGAEIIAYEASEEWIGERDEDGHVVWSQGQVLEMLLEAAHEALMHTRKAFVLAAYHHWERAIRAYTGGNQRLRHRELVERAKREGIVAVPELEMAYRLANTLKHNSDTHGESLFDIWPDVFRAHFRPASGADWYGAVELTDVHVHQVLEAISKAGPKIWPNGGPFGGLV